MYIYINKFYIYLVTNLVLGLKRRFKIRPEVMFKMPSMELVGKIVSISIGLYVAALLIPMALVQLANASFAGVDPAIITIMQVLLPTLAVIGVSLWFLRSE